MNLPQKTTANPWYREPWPWFLMAGPFIVVIAGIATAWIAIRSNDGLVTEDYYRKGLAVNQTIARSEEAARIGLEAAVSVSGDRMSVRLAARDAAFVRPAGLTVTVSHPTRAGLDQVSRLEGAGGSYSGSFRLPAAGHWLVLIEDPDQRWRLMGNVILPASGETVIGAVAAAKPAAD